MSETTKQECEKILNQGCIPSRPGSDEGKTENWLLAEMISFDGCKENASYLKL